MLLCEIFGLEQRSRSEHDWNREMSDKRDGGDDAARYNLVNGAGKIVRADLSKQAAHALLGRPDLVKKYGRLFAKKI